MRIVVAISGASGAVYGVRLLQALASLDHVESHLTVSSAGFLNLQQELDLSRADVEALADVFIGCRMWVHQLPVGPSSAMAW